jgi:solute carrier family 13 (sodium-dependent dicarboxylate transporter), member 2/3/5
MPASPSVSDAPVADPGHQSALSSETSNLRIWLGLLGAPGLLTLVWFAPLGIEAKAQHALAIVSFMVVLWITEAVDHAITALIGCYLFWISGVANFGTAFSGFSQDTPWFLFAAMLLAASASKTGLAKRIAYQLMTIVGTSFRALFLGIIFMSFLLNFFVPSGLAQVATLVPICVGLVAAFGLPPRSNVGRSLFVTLSCTASLFNKMILAGAASLLARGLIENVTHTPIYWSQWLIAFLPAIPLTIFGVWRVVLWLYPPEETETGRGREFLKEGLRNLGPWSPEEKKSLLLGLLAISLWSTDRFHHLSPSLVAIGVGLLACLPKLGVLKISEIRQVNFLPILFVGGVLSMSSVLVETKALNVLTAGMIHWLGPLISNFTEATVVLYWSAFAFHLFLGSELSMLSTSLPPALQFASQHGLNPLASGLVWTFAASAQVFVYQSAVLILGYSYGYFEPKDLLKIGSAMALLEFAILLLVVIFYWPLLGLV